MFGLFSRNKSELELIAPIQGKVVDITAVPDVVFSEKLMGDGVAIEPEGEVVVAPCDGEVVLIARTLHAIGLQAKNGIQVLIHIGLDTVELEGQGFTAHVSVGDKVKAGDKLLTFDKENIASQGKNLISPVVITNMHLIEKINKFINYDKVIMQVKIKTIERQGDIGWIGYWI